jgi:hypothetical protein
MDFNKPSAGPVTPTATPKSAAPEDDREVGSDWMIWDLTIGPGDCTGPTTSNPLTVQAPGLEPGPSLAANLHWRS